MISFLASVGFLSLLGAAYCIGLYRGAQRGVSIGASSAIAAYQKVIEASTEEGRHRMNDQLNFERQLVEIRNRSIAAAINTDAALKN